MTHNDQATDQNVDSSITVRMVRTQAELYAAQRLRFQMFYEAVGITPPAHIAAEGRDFQTYDLHCDHLIAVHQDLTTGAETVVGNYRLMRDKIADMHDGFKSALEYDLSPLKYYGGNVLELGRACVHPDFRSSGVIQKLWAGIAHYVIRHKVDMMLGTASFPGKDVEGIKNALSYLHQNHSAKAIWTPKALSDNYVDMNIVPEDRLDRKTAMMEMPPLIKGYLRLGGVFAKGAYIDHELASVDTCVLVETSRIKKRYQRHYIPGPQPYTDYRANA